MNPPALARAIRLTEAGLWAIHNDPRTPLPQRQRIWRKLLEMKK